MMDGNPAAANARMAAAAPGSSATSSGSRVYTRSTMIVPSRSSSAARRLRGSVTSGEDCRDERVHFAVRDGADVETKPAFVYSTDDGGIAASQRCGPAF